MYIYIYICVYVYMHFPTKILHIYIYIYICIYVYMCICWYSYFPTYKAEIEQAMATGVSGDGKKVKKAQMLGAVSEMLRDSSVKQVG